MAEYNKALDAITLVDLQTVGFTSQVDEYLALNGVSRDAVVAEMERFTDITLALAIGNVKTAASIKEAGQVQAGSPEHAELAKQQEAAAATEAQPEAPQAEVVPEVAPEAAPAVEEGPKAEPEAQTEPQATEAQPEAQAVDAES